MWFALTEDYFSIAPIAYAPDTRLDVGVAQVRAGLSNIFRGQPDSFLTRGRLVDPHAMLNGIPFDLRIERSGLQALEAMEPCLSLRVVFRSGGGADDRVFACPHPKLARSFANAVEGLFDAVERFGYPAHLDRGWLAYPDLRWEVVDALPGGDAVVGAGAYRRAARASSVVARRPGSTGFETLFIWLTSTPDRPFRETPDEIVLTDEDLFVRSHGGRLARVPRGGLVSGRKSSDGDAVYRFGRYISLILVHREGCQVVAALDRQLAAVDAGTSSA